MANVTRRYQLHLMVKLGHLTGPVMGLYYDYRGRLLRHEPGKLCRDSFLQNCGCPVMVAVLSVQWL